MARTSAQILPVRTTIAVIWPVAVDTGRSQTQVSVRPNTLASALIAVDSVEHLDGRARKPMVIEHPNSTLFVSGFALTRDEPGPKLWKSVDRGHSWVRVNVGTAADGAVGNSDAHWQ